MAFLVGMLAFARWGTLVAEETAPPGVAGPEAPEGDRACGSRCVVKADGENASPWDTGGVVENPAVSSPSPSSTVSASPSEPAGLPPPSAASVDLGACVPECDADHICDAGRCRVRFSSGVRSTRTSILEVRSVPLGASVVLDGERIGHTPLAKQIPCGDHTLFLTLAGYDDIQESLRAEVGKTSRHTYEMDSTRQYPGNPLKKVGHALFWPGVTLTGFGVVANWKAHRAVDEISNGRWAEDSARRAWRTVAIASYVSGGVLLVSGLALWIYSPGDKAWWKRHHAMAVVEPIRDGILATFSGGL